MKPRLLACAALLIPALWAQYSLGTGFWNPPGGASPLRPKMECAALRALTGYPFTVATAELKPAEGDVPGYCRVTGNILPEIGFEVALPLEWNRRFLMTGNGGYAGVISPNFARPGLRHGFVVAADNTGHDYRTDPGATFAKDRQKLYDYAFRSLHVTPETAKFLAQKFYGSAPLRSYFEGCSTGGRQALILAQRFPDDFDGIISGAPVLDFTGTMIAFACTGQALMAAPIPYAKLSLLAERIYAGCDAKDGLKDGIIDDPRRCDFQPSRDLPHCAPGTDNNQCFTAAQIGALEKLYADIRSQGKRIFPGWPVGAEAAPPGKRAGWDQWIIRDQGPSIDVQFSESFFRYMATPKIDPTWSLAQFDVNKDPERLEWIHTVLDATESDLSPFQKHGGRLLMYHGWADEALNPLMSVEYYDKVRRRMGSSTEDFFRLFMVPGMFHCGGGVGVGGVNMLAPLVEWVELGKAPQRLILRGKHDGQERTRPICAYPERAKYNGSGNPDEEASFACVAP